MQNFKPINFPQGFLWGAATSSHQVEGENFNDWSKWEKSQKRIKFLESKGLIKKYGLENFISGKATDHYHRFSDDFRLAKKLGHNATRFSIEWSRIEPEAGYFNEKEIEHYKEVIAVLKELKIEPFVTLWHFTLPVWLSDKGGWLNKDTPNYFARYAEKIVTALGNSVNFWITINEPEVYASNSYLVGDWPPQKKNLISYLCVLKHLIQAHKKTYQIIKKINPQFQVGIAKNNIYFEPYKNKLINRFIKKIIDWWWNFYVLDQINNYQDFIGLNYYFHLCFNYFLNKNKNKNVSDLGQELDPGSIYFALKELKHFNKPIYITENGLADANDQKRSWFIFETLKGIKKSIDENINVRGYFHWSLLDNFEWNKGFWPRFGLVEVDYQTLERKIRHSAQFYQDVCLLNGISEDIFNRYQKLLQT